MKNYRRFYQFWSNRLKIRRYRITQPSLRFLCPDVELPWFVQQCPITRHSLNWLRPFAWQNVIAKASAKRSHQMTVSRATYIASYLVKIDQRLTTMGQLRRFLINHPALIWVLGYPLVPDRSTLGFNPELSVPSRRQFSRMLSTLPNALLQCLLDEQVGQLKTTLPASFGQTVSLDTKHILSWLKENNPKAYIKEGRYDKTKQPAGDPDCKLGCKRRRNLLTPTLEGKPGRGKRSIGEFYWGYASGAVVTKVKGYGEFVLAEMTQTFDKGDTHYFFPLMEATVRRLGFKPTYGTMDAAFDAFYVYDYFHNPDGEGLAAVPFNQPNGRKRLFDQMGLPLCEAGLAMPVRKEYTDNTKAIISHRRAFHACPLLFPQPNGQVCPINHKLWPKGGCSAQLPTSVGARIRHQLDRESELYKEIYKQRTAVERIFSQATALGMERPKLRHYQAIANHNTLIYLLINARTIGRVANHAA